MKAPALSFHTALVALGVALLAVFLGHLAWRGLHREYAQPQWEVEGGDPARGLAAIERYGCAACHVVPGIRMPRGRVGPKLEDFRNQTYIAGMLPNTPENVVEWIQRPQEINPQTAMPTLGLTEQEARDVAAYLYANP